MALTCGWGAKFVTIRAVTKTTKISTPQKLPAIRELKLWLLNANMLGCYTNSKGQLMKY